MTRYKKASVFLLALTGSILLILSSAYSKKDYNLFEVGRQAKEIYDLQKNSSKKAGRVALKINGDDVTFGEVAYVYWAGELMGEEELSRQEVIKRLVRNIALDREVKKRGITVSEQELQDYSSRMKELLSAPGSEGIGRKGYLDFLNGLGYTEDNFWESDYAKEGSQRALMAAKLREDVLEEAPSEIRGNNKKEWEYFEKRIDDLIEKAEVEILDESAFDD